MAPSRGRGLHRSGHNAAAPTTTTTTTAVAAFANHNHKHVERTVGAHVRASLAAERALEAGEQVEDTLWMGSGRLDGSYVRRQLQHCRSTRQQQQQQRSSSSLMGSQRFLQSMRFWEATNTTSSASKRANSLEYNGGTTGTSTAVLRVQNPLGSLLLHSPSTLRLPTYAGRDRELPYEVTRLLSMRCEASRSIRLRKRNHHNHNNFVQQWFTTNTALEQEQEQEQEQAAEQATARPRLTLLTGMFHRPTQKQNQNQKETPLNPLHVRNSQHSRLLGMENSDHTNKTSQKKPKSKQPLQLKPLKQQQQQQQQQQASPKSPLKKKIWKKLLFRQNDTDLPTISNHQHHQTQTNFYKNNIIDRDDPIRLSYHQKPSFQSLDSSSTVTTNTNTPPLPADVQLKQQWAQAQKRTSLHRGSRHLTDNDNDNDNNDNTDNNTMNFDTSHTLYYRQRQNLLELQQQQQSDQFESFRSTRLDVANQPLLSRQPRIHLPLHSPTPSDLLSNDDDDDDNNDSDDSDIDAPRTSNHPQSQHQYQNQQHNQRQPQRQRQFRRRPPPPNSQQIQNHNHRNEQQQQQQEQLQQQELQEHSIPKSIQAIRQPSPTNTGPWMQQISALSIISNSTTGNSTNQLDLQSLDDDYNDNDNDNDNDYDNDYDNDNDKDNDDRRDAVEMENDKNNDRTTTTTTTTANNTNTNTTNTNNNTNSKNNNTHNRKVHWAETRKSSMNEHMEDDEEEIFYSVQELIDSTRAELADSDWNWSSNNNSNTGSNTQQPLEPEGSRLRYWFEEQEDYNTNSDDDDDDEEDIGGAATNIFQSSSSLPATTITSIRNSKNFMQEQAGMIRLECLAEEREEDLIESELFGVDQQFGSTAQCASLSSLLHVQTAAMTNNARRSSSQCAERLHDSHSTSDSNGQSNNLAQDIWLPRSNYSNNKHFDEKKTSSRQPSGFKSRRQRGYRYDKLDDGDEDDSLEHESFHNSSYHAPTIPTVFRHEQTKASTTRGAGSGKLPPPTSITGQQPNSGAVVNASSNSDGDNKNSKFRRRTLPTDALGPRQHGIRGGIILDYAEECRNERRRSSVPRNFVTRSDDGKDESESSSNVSNDHDDEDEDVDQSGGEVTLVSKPSESSHRTSSSLDPPETSRCSSDPPGHRPCHPPGCQDEGDKDDKDHKEEGCEVVWKGGPAVDTVDATNDKDDDWWKVASDDDSALHQTHSFCADLDASWDKDDDHGEHLYFEMDDSGGYYDTRSVVSEPADMGMGESFLTAADMTDPANNPWLMAWDDLALL